MAAPLVSLHIITILLLNLSGLMVGCEIAQGFFAIKDCFD
jgi:hypothetical protein